MPGRLDSLHQALTEMARRHSDAPLGPIEPEALFEQFVLSGMEYKGQLASGFAASGKSAQTSAAFDAGDLVLPGVVTLEAKATVQAEKLRYSLVVLQHLGEGPAPLSPASLPRPLGLAVYSGHLSALSLKLSADAGLGVPSPLSGVADAINAVGPESLAASLEISAGTSASVSYKGSAMRLRDPSPRWFRTAMEPALAEAFHARLGSGDKSSLRESIGDWLATWCEVKVKRSRHTNLSRFYKTQDLLAGLDSAEQKLKASGAPKADSRYATIAAWRTQLARVKDDEGKAPVEPAPGAPPLDQLCFLHLWGHEGGAGASVTASLALGVGKASANAELGASADGALKHTTFRYQTCGVNDAGRPLVLTQDVVIDYRQANLSASASAKAVLEHDAKLMGATAKHESGHEWSKAKTYNMMTYQAATMVWEYGGATQATALEGTGVSFGASALVLRLVVAARELVANAVSKTTDSLLSTLAWRLRVSVDVMKDYLRGSLFASFEPAEVMEWFPTDCVLLESSFDAPLGRAFELETHKGTRRVRAAASSALLAPFHTRGRLPEGLLAIRARYRIADLREITRTVFKLGLGFAVKVGFELANVEYAGVEGIIDLHTRWYGRLAPVQDAKSAYNRAVPAVALFHQ